ncbi:MAG: ATP-binding cassette domain-containing protein [Chloroflexi bacterium]|nr:ATP-binding cassette domain-containing protein [Chloroflexota bacterium]
MDSAQPTPVLLQVQNLKKYFPIEKGFLRKVVGHVKAVDDVSLYIRRNETLGLVGESGSGKTTLGRCLLRAIEPTAGQIMFYPEDSAPIDVVALDKPGLKAMRRKAQIVFQNPYSSLDPRKTILQIVGEPLILHNVAKGDELVERVKQLMNLVGLEVQYMNRYPHAFSGGQRQRIGVARALALNPELIIADEPVSALDVSIQAQILNLLQDIRSELNLSFLFIAHSLNVIRHVSHRVAVMYVGKIVEMADVVELFTNPRHPYTESLLSAIPKPDPDLRMKRIILQGEVANPANPPSGCYFHPRCRYAKDICKQQAPVWEELSPGHFVACHRAKELELVGVPLLD